MPNSDDSKIQQFYDDLFESAAGIVKRGETHQPIAIVLEESGSNVFMVAGRSVEERAQWFKALAASPRVVAAALIYEGWYVAFEPKEEDSLRLAVERGLSEHPNRQEVLVFRLLTATRQAVMYCFIDRATDTLQKAPFEWLSAGEAVGRSIQSEEQNHR